MSSLRQELAAILMDHTDAIPEATYMAILNELAAIPAHKDPKKAAELENELENERKRRELVEEENEILQDEVAQLEETLEVEREASEIIAMRLSRYIGVPFQADESEPECDCNSDCDYYCRSCQIREGASRWDYEWDQNFLLLKVVGDGGTLDSHYAYCLVHEEDGWYKKPLSYRALHHSKDWRMYKASLRHERTQMEKLDRVSKTVYAVTPLEQVLVGM